jgi:hypothetical protein
MVSKSLKALDAGAQYHPWSTSILAREEARRRGDRRVGTEHVLLALLVHPSLASAVGADAQRARATLERMDGDALAAIGLEHPPDAPPLPAGDPHTVPARPKLKAVLRGHMRLTPAATAVLRESSKGMRRGASHPGPEHVLAGLLELQRPDPAAELLAALGAEPATVRARLADA